MMLEVNQGKSKKTKGKEAGVNEMFLTMNKTFHLSWNFVPYILNSQAEVKVRARSTKSAVVPEHEVRSYIPRQKCEYLATARISLVGLKICLSLQSLLKDGRLSEGGK